MFTPRNKEKTEWNGENCSNRTGNPVGMRVRDPASLDSLIQKDALIRAKDGSRVTHHMWSQRYARKEPKAAPFYGWQGGIQASFFFSLRK